MLRLRLKIFDDLGQTDHDQNNLSFIKSPGAVLSQIVDPLLVLADDSFPGAMVAGQAPFHQLRVGSLQPYGSVGFRCLDVSKRGLANKSFKLLLPF